MAYSTISKPSLHFNTKLYTGTGSELAITGVGFQPDFVWTKSRSNTLNHNLYDAVRGVTKGLKSNTSDAEFTEAQSLKSFNSDGFTVGTDSHINTSSATFASWNWKANGQGSSNTDGTINSTYTSVNTTSGFSIVTYTGTGSAGTVGHGLGTTPSMVWIFNRTDGGNGHVFHKALGSTQYLLHASTLGVQTYAPVGIGSLTSSTFSVGTVGGVNGSSKNYVAYVFAEKKGYSKIGNYTGNDNANGTFVYTGFKPSFVLIKRTNASDNWYIYDNKRDGYNVDNNDLHPNNTDAESTDDKIDLLSNGFKLRMANNDVNGDGDTYIYYAVAEEPLVANVGNSIPATAR